MTMAMEIPWQWHASSAMKSLRDRNNVWFIWDAEHHTDIQRKETEAVIWTLMSLWHAPTRAHEEAINSDDTTDG